MAYNPPGGAYPYGKQPPPGQYPQQQSYGQQPYGSSQQPYGAPGAQPAYNTPQYGVPSSAPSPYGGAPQYGATPGAPQYGATPGASQYGATPGAPQYGATPGAPTGTYGQLPAAPLAPSYGAPVPSAPLAPQYGSQMPGQPGAYGAPYPGAMSQQYNVPPEVLAWFQAVDQDRSGRISSAELQKALLNANNREFRYDSVRLLFNMVDKSRVGMIDVNQFGTLITFINDWRSKFDRFDVARTGAINGNNLAEVFRSLGFQLSPTFCATVIRMWGSRTRPGALEFDGFLAVVVLVRTFTDKFAAKDAQHNGNARISYEEFLAMVFDSELV